MKFESTELLDGVLWNCTGHVIRDLRFAPEFEICARICDLCQNLRFAPGFEICNLQFAIWARMCHLRFASEFEI